MRTALAPALEALSALMRNVHGDCPAGVPLITRAIDPAGKPAQSAAVHPRLSPDGFASAAVTSPLPEQVIVSKSVWSTYVTALGVTCANADAEFSKHAS